MGHIKPPIPIHIDNTTAVGIVNNTIKRQRSKAFEIQYFWLLDQEAQRIFKFHHHTGKENLGDYYTKGFDAPHHTTIKPLYIYLHNSPKFMTSVHKATRRGCVENIPAEPVSKPQVPLSPTYNNVCSNLVAYIKAVRTRQHASAA